MNDTNTRRDSSSRSLACSPLSAAILNRRFLRRLIIALLTSAVAWNQFFQPVDRLDKLTLNTTIISSVEKKHAESDNDHKDPPSPASATRKTAVVIFTHLINAHPSLDPLMTIYNGTKRYLNGLPEKAPYFITVDGIKDIPKNMEGELFLMENQENRNKYDEYIRQLQIHFKDHDNVKILIAGKNIGLANNIRRVIDNLSPDTKYMYFFQHDLPLVREINHTDILVTAEANVKMRLVGFKGDDPIQRPCGDDIVSESGIFYRRFKLWTDRNHFARIDHYKNDILPRVTSVFPEDNMHKPTRLNCTYFAPYYYEGGKGDPYYKHTDASERYGFKLFERVKRGEVAYSSLSKVNIMVMERMGVNMTELETYKSG
mmetsp:Transcript_1991/g.2863  ORF Transcript_1991/g.2863 Transcript_1991/m.2863 type:complete len:372 (-) Transcript_1991:227-1342(-)